MAKSPKETKGPVVKTGPTRGQNRSRNNDGSWRSKRSDAGKASSKASRDSSGGGKRGCFLTTAICDVRGLPDNCHELSTLRNFRDIVLAKSDAGAALIEEYYSVAPSLVAKVSEPKCADIVWDAVQSTIALIETGEHKAAIEHYRSMVKQLMADNIA